MATIVICFSTPLEGENFPTAIAGHALTLLHTGVGPVNAAFTLTRCLSTRPANMVVACGVGGAYPTSGLEPGDVVSAASETYGDLGAESPDGFLDMKVLGFPVVPGEQPLFNQLPVDFFPTDWHVPFVTNTTCTGTEASATAIAARTLGAVESMEGAAIVHVARLMGVAVGEVRGISNAVGVRDRGSWRVGEAAAHARTALANWIEGLAC